jgi:hypothetical protein
VCPYREPFNTSTDKTVSLVDTFTALKVTVPHVVVESSDRVNVTGCAPEIIESYIDGAVTEHTVRVPLVGSGSYKSIVILYSLFMCLNTLFSYTMRYSSRKQIKAIVKKTKLSLSFPMYSSNPKKALFMIKFAPSNNKMVSINALSLRLILVLVVQFVFRFNLTFN